MVNQATRPHKKTVDLVICVHLLDCIEDTTDYIMPAWRLTSRENNAYVNFVRCLFVTRNKFYKRHAISVREQFLDFVLITYTLSRLAFLYLYGTLKTLWKLRLILSTSLLQKTHFHFSCIFCLVIYFLVQKYAI